jgi:protocatechuate 3,4-dioxygenase beta subunit
MVGANPSRLKHPINGGTTMPEETVHDLDANTVTDAVLEQLARTPDPRMREVLSAAVRHMHAFAREVSLTPAEWLAAIGFLTQVGHACTPVRQEFILLSDVLGLSALVNIMHDRNEAELGTQSSLLGPFFREGSPQLALGDCIVSQHTAPEIVVYGRVTGMDGKGVPDATVAVWQTNEHGVYDLQVQGGSAMDMRGTFRTDADGNYFFRTVRPLGYSIPMDGPVGRLVKSQKRHGFRPSHIHFLIGAPGFRELVTALYFGDDTNIASDTVFGVSRSLVVNARADDPDAPIKGLGAVRYDFQLSVARGENEGRVGADPAAFMPAAE